MRMDIRQFLIITVALFYVLVSSIITSTTSAAAPGDTIRWNIVNVSPTLVVDAGGQASARAEDGSKITLTGSGTFRIDELSNNVTGGGTWETHDLNGNLTGSGTYRVLRNLRFDFAPGSLPSPPFTDNIGNNADARAGLAFLRIVYSDGTPGVLVVSCHLAGTPDSVFEGITASKGFVDYWRHESGNTLFHVTN